MPQRAGRARVKNAVAAAARRTLVGLLVQAVPATGRCSRTLQEALTLGSLAAAKEGCQAGVQTHVLVTQILKGMHDLSIMTLHACSLPSQALPSSLRSPTCHSKAVGMVALQARDRHGGAQGRLCAGACRRMQPKFGGGGSMLSVCVCSCMTTIRPAVPVPVTTMPFHDRSVCGSPGHSELVLLIARVVAPLTLQNAAKSAGLLPTTPGAAGGPRPTGSSAVRITLLGSRHRIVATGMQLLPVAWVPCP